MKRKILFFSILEIIAFCFAILGTMNSIQIDRHIVVSSGLREASLYELYHGQFNLAFFLGGWCMVLIAEIVRRRLKRSLDRGRE
jgi:hypothetical protein